MLTEEQWRELEEEHCCDRGSLTPGEVEGKLNALKVQEGGSHYKNFPIQPVEYCQKNGLSYCEANVVKYVSRHKEKNGAEDIKKAMHYLKLILLLEYNIAS